MNHRNNASSLDWRQMEVVDNPHKIKLTDAENAEQDDSYTMTIDLYTIGADQIIGEPILITTEDELPILNLNPKN